MKRNLISAFLCSSLLLSGAEFPVSTQEFDSVEQSESQLPASGDIGTAEWSIDSNGVLTIGEGIYDSDEFFFLSPWSEYVDSITRVDGTANFTITGSLGYAFWGGSNIESIDLSGWNTSGVTDLTGTFTDCSNLKSLNIGNWNTSNVTSMGDVTGYGTFAQCSSLTSLDIRSWDTSSVTDMSNLFAGCTSLTDLDLSSWDVSSVTSMDRMFQGCSSLGAVDLHSWNTSNIKSMKCLFTGCSNLASVNIKPWNTSNLLNMYAMFENCTSLTALDLGSWDTSKVTSMYGVFGAVPGPDGGGVFSGCTNLKTLDIRSWDTSSVLPPDENIREEDLEKASVFGFCSKLETIYYSQKSTNILKELPASTGWYQNDRGPYAIKDLPVLADGQVAVLTRTAQSNPEQPVENDLSKAALSGVNASYEEIGKAITPKPIVKIGSKTLSEGKEYKLIYSNNVNPGKATITITGIGTYKGVKTVTFTITAKKKPEQPVENDLSKAALSGVNTSYEETGKAITPKPVVKIGSKTLSEGKDYKLTYSNNVNPGKATITITGIGAYKGAKTVTFTITAKKKPVDQKPADQKPADQNPPQASVKKITMHRLYNPNSGEHFYTANTAEKDLLVKLGWKYEGEGWKAPDKSKTPVHRLYNPNAGDHHYTLDVNEKNHLVKVGWNYEGVGWYSDDAKSVPLYRQYNPNAKAGSHNYTTDKGENDGLAKLGWKAEGIGWYGMK